MVGVGGDRGVVFSSQVAVFAGCSEVGVFVFHAAIGESDDVVDFSCGGGAAGEGELAEVAVPVEYESAGFAPLGG